MINNAVSHKTDLHSTLSTDWIHHIETHGTKNSGWKRDHGVMIRDELALRELEKAELFYVYKTYRTCCGSHPPFFKIVFKKKITVWVFNSVLPNNPWVIKLMVYNFCFVTSMSPSVFESWCRIWTWVYSPNSLRHRML